MCKSIYFWIHFVYERVYVHILKSFLQLKLSVEWTCYASMIWFLKKKKDKKNIRFRCLFIYLLMSLIHLLSISLSFRCHRPSNESVFLYIFFSASICDFFFKFHFKLKCVLGQREQTCREKEEWHLHNGKIDETRSCFKSNYEKISFSTVIDKVNELSS